MIISTDTGKASEKSNTLLRFKKFFKNFGIKGTFFNLIKGIYEKNRANTIFNGERLTAFLLNSGTRQEFPLSPFLLNIVLPEVLARTIKSETSKKHPD